MRLLALVSLVALLMTVAAPVQADTPIDVDGTWWYYVYDVELREEGCAIATRVPYMSLWQGDFSALTFDEGMVATACSGLTTFRGRNYFDGVTIDGKTGSFVMAVDGRLPIGEEWRGQWEIISASGELEGMLGSGTWWGPGAGGPFMWGYVYYDGTVVVPD